MTKIHSAASHNGKIHPIRLRAASVKLIVAPPVVQSYARLSVSLAATMASKVRDLAFTERTSESAVIEAALWRFFASGDASKLPVILRRSGIAPRRRKT